jgi:hypothetical protein
MKNLIPYCLVPLVLLAACKKDVKVSPAVPAKTTEVVFPSDSISYTIDGKTYTLNTSGGVITGNTEANRSINLSNNSVSGSKDTVFFYRIFKFSGAGSGFNLSFFKKFAVKDMVPGVIYSPTSQEDLFKPGNYKYGTDFNRENATNGVALAVDNIWQTYSDQALGVAVPITTTSESNAHFKILSFKKINETDLQTQYVLEAKFDAALFNNYGAMKQLTDGYVRIIVAIGK